MLHLASKSPRRRELLTRLGVRFAVLDIDIPEVRAAHERAEDYVRRVAREKAEAGFRQLDDASGAVVIGADTEVVLDEEVFGKPRDAADAEAMLRRLSGRTHLVLSAVSVHSRQAQAQALSATQVRFAPLAEDTITAYAASGEPMGKAGAYAIQGVAETFVAHLSGSYSGVMGLPLFETAELLRGLGIVPAAASGPAGPSPRVGVGRESWGVRAQSAAQGGDAGIGPGRDPRGALPAGGRE